MYRRRRGLRPLLVLQWIIVMMIIMVIFRSLGLPWFFWFFPFIFVCNWGGGWRHGKRRWHRRHRHHRRRYRDEFEDEEDDSDYV